MSGRKDGRNGRREGKAAPRNGRGGRGGAPSVRHPGGVLAEILDDTPLPVAAKWFSITPEALVEVLEGRAPVTNAMAVVAGTVFGTGSAPWIEMQRLYDEAEAARALRAAERAARGKNGQAAG